MKITVRQRYLSTQWEVVQKYGCRETLLAVKDSEREAKEYAKAERDFVRAFTENKHGELA